MKDYRKLSEFHRKRVDKEIVENVEPGNVELGIVNKNFSKSYICINSITTVAIHKNKHSGFEWTEPDYTLAKVHAGDYCAECWMIYYNCLCSHDY